MMLNSLEGTPLMNVEQKKRNYKITQYISDIQRCDSPVQFCSTYYFFIIGIEEII